MIFVKVLNFDKDIAQRKRKNQRKPVKIRKIRGQKNYFFAGE